MNPDARIVFFTRPRPLKCAISVFLSACDARHLYNAQDITRPGANIYYKPVTTDAVGFALEAGRRTIKSKGNV